MKLGNLVKHYVNKRNLQEKFDLKKSELKKNNISVRDLLDMEVKINDKLRKFEDI